MAELTVAIGGFGAIGAKVARALDGGMPGLRLTAVSALDHAGARSRMDGMKSPPPVVELQKLAALADVVVECAPANVFREVALGAIEAGKIFMPLSCGALLRNTDLAPLADRTGAQIIVPTGALVGLDAVRAAAEGTIYSVHMITRKPPKGLSGAPHLVNNNISINNLSSAMLVFEGTARDAAEAFPANVNVAAALSLAGNGPDKTTIEIWADPDITRNTHTIKVESDATRFEIFIEGVPSLENPATGMLTPLSVLAALRCLVTTMKVGT